MLLGCEKRSGREGVRLTVYVRLGTESGEAVEDRVYLWIETVTGVVVGYVLTEPAGGEWVHDLATNLLPSIQTPVPISSQIGIAII